jgi:cellulose synthase/poly-beta-1,6-N-acetylglucosamine synthase-like glycosyltransferase
MELNLANILLVVMAFFFAIQLFYFLFFFIRMLGKQKKVGVIPNEDLKPISVIICAQNEEKNLLEYLPKILEQNYPTFQIVLVNDRSWDETYDVMDALARKFSTIKVVNIPNTGNDLFAKKFALTLGIKAAMFDQLVLIDADCYPTHQNWLRELTGQFSSKKTLVLGAGGYVRTKGFLNRLIRFDTIYIAMNYLSYAKAGLPYMGVGRNLAYKNELYDSIRGFKSHYHIKSGDDDLFVNEAATKANTAIAFNDEVITLTPAKTTFKDWIRQKRRHFSTGKHYKLVHKFLLTLFPVSFLLFLLSMLAFILFHPMWWIALALFGARSLLLVMSLYKVGKPMQSKDVVWLAPYYELLMLFLNPYLIFTHKKI